MRVKEFHLDNSNCHLYNEANSGKDNLYHCNGLVYLIFIH